MGGVPAEELADWFLLKEGDSEALARLYRRYARLLINYGYRIVADKELVRDVVQDQFVHLWSSRSSLPDVQSIKAYLMVAVRRQLLRRTTARPQFEEIPDDSLLPTLSEPSVEIQLIDSHEIATISERMAKAIEKLPPRQREVIFLKYYSDLSTQEIAETMGITPESVYKFIYKAIDNLKVQSKGWETAGLSITMLLFYLLGFAADTQ